MSVANMQQSDRLIDAGPMNSPRSGEEFIQEYCEQWLPRYYLRLDKEVLGRLVQGVTEKRLPAAELLYIVLGCGYLFEVQSIDPDRRFREIQARMNSAVGPEISDLLQGSLMEKAIRKQIETRGFVIGPEAQSLNKTRRPGPTPIPAPKIAALCVDRWASRRRPDLDSLQWALWARDLYRILTGRSVNDETYKRWRTQASGSLVNRSLPAEPNGSPVETQLTAIEDLFLMFDSRYTQFHRHWSSDEAHRLSLDAAPGNLYPIGGVLRPVLKAVGINLDPEPDRMVTLFQKRG